MAVSHSPLLRRLRRVAAKIETTPGTAETLADANAAYHVRDLVIQQEVEMTQREKQGGFTMLPSVIGGYKGRARFTSLMYGASAAPTWAAMFLPCVGLGAYGGAYVLDSKPPEASGSTCRTATIASYQAARKKYIYGAMGNARFNFPAGQVATVEFDFLGKWAAPADVADLSPTYPTLSPLRVISASLTIGSWAPKIANLTLDLGNQIYLREDVNDATGYSSACIGNRLVTGSIDDEASIVAVKNVFSDWAAGTEASLSIVLSAGAATCTVTATKLQFINPQEGDRNGVEIDNLAFQLNNDDLTFTFV